jgi:hypothetical protein
LSANVPDFNLDKADSHKHNNPNDAEGKEEKKSLEIRRAINMVELVPTLSNCIESTAKKEYWKSVEKYLQLSEEDKELEGKIELLKVFLESADFRELRRQSENYLVGGKNVKFILFLEEGSLRYKMKVEGGD